MRKIKDSDLAGKTIQKIDTESVNVLELFFTDGTSVKLWAEDAVYTPMGSIPGIFIDEETEEEDGESATLDPITLAVI